MFSSAIVKITYGVHARDILAERGIARTWVEHTIMVPDSTKPDPQPADRTRAYRAVPERDERLLRVVYVTEAEGAHVATAFLDRGRRRRAT
ncbi:hypothetical protein ADL19_05640 [Streptomyces purpurogeneiscleroticus]|nr:hypothetical protein ADL19_05640 [Streptomyces purpurogeneiscleroticus]